MAYLLWRLQIHQRYLSRLVDDFPDQLLFCIIATRRAQSVRLTASEMVNMNILREAKWNNLGQKSSATVDVAPPMISEKHSNSNMCCFPIFFPTTLEVATWFLSNFLRGFTRATTCCVTRRVPWCAVWPCRSWIITVWWTSFRWQDLRNLVKNGILVGLKLFWRPKCRNFRNKYEYWMICLYIINSIYSI